MNSPSPAIDIESLQPWIGRTETVHDIATERLVASLRATLESEKYFPSCAAPEPLTLHWCLAPPVAPMSGIGPDGHPARGGFLPPIPLPRRMWAGGELEFHDRIVTGDVVERTSHIAKIEVKEGRTGTLCFVQVDHTMSTSRGVAIQERQDIVYRAAETAPTMRQAQGPSPSAEHSIRLHASPVLLFRYSALTFNGHRIHYDQPYATGVEHYPGLVVHGPLQAALLVEFATEIKKGTPPRRFTFRGVHPLFDGADFFLKAHSTDGGMAMWVENAGGGTTMKAEAYW